MQTLTLKPAPPSLLECVIQCWYRTVCWCSSSVLLCLSLVLQAKNIAQVVLFRCSSLCVLCHIGLGLLCWVCYVGCVLLCLVALVLTVAILVTFSQLLFIQSCFKLHVMLSRYLVLCICLMYVRGVHLVTFYVNQHVMCLFVRLCLS